MERETRQRERQGRKRDKDGERDKAERDKAEREIRMERERQGRERDTDGERDKAVEIGLTCCKLIAQCAPGLQPESPQTGPAEASSTSLCLPWFRQAELARSSQVTIIHFRTASIPDYFLVSTALRSTAATCGPRDVMY